jgi:hypothetical protein
MPDLVIDAISVLRDSVWGGIAVVLVVLGWAARWLYRRLAPSDLTRDELRLLKAFNEEARGDPKAYLKPEFVAYRAKLDKCAAELQRLKDRGYLEESNIKGGYIGHRPVWITAKGMRRAGKRR